jgi:hypothetical protein
MNDAITHQAGHAVRASDHERDQVVAQLQRGFADGRLTQADLEERVGAALAAQTRGQLHALTTDLPGTDLPGTDLPGTDVRPAGPTTVLDPLLLCALLVLCPPAGVAYWFLSRRRIGCGWLLRRQLAGVPNWAWILIIAVAGTAAARR